MPNWTTSGVSLKKRTRWGAKATTGAMRATVMRAEIFSAAPTDTPFLSMCGRTEASQALHEWQTDDLVPPGENERLEGAETAEFTATTSTELNNKTQILAKAVSVSGTVQAVRQGGAAHQYNYQLALRTKELKKDVEYALLHNKLQRADNGTNARLMTGLPCWISAENSSLGASGKNATASTACVAGTGRVPTEADLKALLTKIYAAGGNPDRIMMSPEIRVKMSEVLTGGGTKMEKAEEKTVHAVIDVYVSDFGTLKLIPNRVQSYETYSKGCAFVIDPEYWKVAYLRGFTEEKLAKTGDSMKGHVLVECTLEARNPASSGMMADLIASA